MLEALTGMEQLIWLQELVFVMKLLLVEVMKPQLVLVMKLQLVLEGLLF